MKTAHKRNRPAKQPSKSHMNTKNMYYLNTSQRYFESRDTTLDPKSSFDTDLSKSFQQVSSHRLPGKNFLAASQSYGNVTRFGSHRYSDQSHFAKVRARHNDLSRDRYRDKLEKMTDKQHLIKVYAARKSKSSGSFQGPKDEE